MLRESSLSPESRCNLTAIVGVGVSSHRVRENIRLWVDCEVLLFSSGFLSHHPLRHDDDVLHRVEGAVSVCRKLCVRDFAKNPPIGSVSL